MADISRHGARRIDPDKIRKIQRSAQRDFDRQEAIIGILAHQLNLTKTIVRRIWKEYLNDA